ncbi:MAG: beta-ketoacyl-ACP synthase III [Steroidobacteraceae bacterium]
MTMYSKIVGTGSYLPEKVLTNADMEQLVDTSDEWIRSRTGIERRHIVADNETTLDMAEQAALRAMQAAGVIAAEIDLIVIGTTTPDQIFPNTGCLLQQRLGVFGPPAIQLEAACSSFIYALSVADKFVRLGDAKCALVIGAECLTRLVDWKDRNTCVLFGDGAGAVILKPSTAPGILSTHLHASGDYADLLYYPTGPSKLFNSNVPADCQRVIQMKGKEVFKVAINKLGEVVDETLAANNLSKSDIDWLVPHQANMRIVQGIAKKLDLPMERVIVTIQDQGNTSAASVPLALDTGIRDGRIKPGSLVLLEAFGGGFTWGSALVRI